jgi:elongation factor Ts
MEITASVVKQLREKTGVGMMECKSALVEAKGDLAEAEKILRKKGLSAAANKAGRATGEGVVAARVTDDGRLGILVEVNCETDFAARGADFQALVGEIADHVLHAEPAATPEAMLDQPLHGGGGKTVRQRIGEAVAKIGENMQIPRVARFDARASGPAAIATYLHTGSKIGVMIEAEVHGDAAAALRDVAMHVAAAAPRFVRRDEVSQKVLDDEKEIAREQALKAGKPPAVVEKIVTGRMEKYFSEACLLEQPFVKDPDKTVAQFLGDRAVVRRFARFVLGESA